MQSTYSLHFVTVDYSGASQCVCRQQRLWSDRKMSRHVFFCLVLVTSSQGGLTEWIWIWDCLPFPSPVRRGESWSELLLFIYPLSIHFVYRHKFCLEQDTVWSNGEDSSQSCTQSNRMISQLSLQRSCHVLFIGTLLLTGFMSKMFWVCIVSICLRYLFWCLRVH